MFDFVGRARRSEYWWFMLFRILLIFGGTFGIILVIARDPAFAAAMQTPDGLAFYLQRNNDAATYVGYGIAAYVFLIWLPSFSVLIRRLHDTNRSGWFILMPTLVSFISGLVGGFMAAASGTEAGAAMGGFVVLIPPVIAYIWFLVVLCMPGTHGTNRFGPDSAPGRKRPPPAHPAFAAELDPEERAERDVARKEAAKDYYRTHVLPNIKKSPLEN